MMKRYALPIVTGIVVLASVACSIDVSGEGSVVNEEKRFPVTGAVDLSVRTFDGSVEVRSWDRNEVLVRIERRAASAEDAKALTVETRQDGNRIVIEAPERDSARFGRRSSFRFGVWQSPSVSFIVTAPRQVTLAVRTGDGSIAAGELAGTITLQTGDGSIRADRLEGEVRANTGDGSIEVDGVRGKVDLDSGDGSIRVVGRLEDVRVHSGDGAVTVEAAEGSAMKNEWSLTTGDGAIAVRLPTGFDAEVDAQSGDGQVTAEGISQDAPRNDDERNVARGRLGKGGHTIHVRSGDGAITIRTR